MLASKVSSFQKASNIFHFFNSRNHLNEIFLLEQGGMSSRAENSSLRDTSRLSISYTTKLSSAEIFLFSDSDNLDNLNPAMTTFIFGSQKNN